MSPKSTKNPVTFEKRSCIPKTMLQKFSVKTIFPSAHKLKEKKTEGINCHVTMETLSRTKGVYMTMGRISRRREFTPVPSRGSVFVYMIRTIT